MANTQINVNVYDDRSLRIVSRTPRKICFISDKLATRANRSRVQAIRPKYIQSLRYSSSPQCAIRAINSRVHMICPKYIQSTSKSALQEKKVISGKPLFGIYTELPQLLTDL